MNVLKALELYVPLFQTSLWCFLILCVVLVLHEPLKGLLQALKQRLEAGSSLKIGDVELGPLAMVTKTADLNVPVKVFGNPDRLELLFKATSSNWTNSTKAMQLPTGCLVQVTNEQRRSDGTWVPSEALAFVPGVVIQDEPDGQGRYLSQRSTERDEVHQ